MTPQNDQEKGTPPGSFRWDRRYDDPQFKPSATPSAFLVENVNLLPLPGSTPGLALDIAAGAGHNSVYLASLGLAVVALDYSLSGLHRCRDLARQSNVQVLAAVVDLDHASLPADGFDLIINFKYLNRELAPGLVRALRPGGILVFETMTREFLKKNPAFNPDYLLEPGELGRMFQALEPLVYRENPAAGTASLVARKLGEG